MHDRTTLTRTGSINRRVLLLALALVAVAGIVSAKTWFVGNTTDEPGSQSAVISNAASQISRLEQSVRDRPDDGVSLTQLASAFVKRARETGDPSLYLLAAKSVKRALILHLVVLQTLIVAGGLQLPRLKFFG